MSVLSISSQLACIDIYNPIDTKKFRHIYTSGDTVCGTRLFDGIFYIVCQGTSNTEGWLADFDCSIYDHPILGGLHTGFWDNLPDLIPKLLLDIPLNTPVICTGHSKGAAEAALLSAELYLKNINIKQCILFACPNPGDEKFAIWMQKNISGSSYRNATLRGLFGDPVPLVPTEPFVAPYPHTIFTEYPKNWIDKALPTKWHQAELYYLYGSFP
jgi:hypothetical protein